LVTLSSNHKLLGQLDTATTILPSVQAIARERLTHFEAPLGKQNGHDCRQKGP